MRDRKILKITRQSHLAPSSYLLQSDIDLSTMGGEVW